jgi:TolB-like protein/Tfp pilus assembly protein PilF
MIGQVNNQAQRHDEFLPSGITSLSVNVGLWDVRCNRQIRANTRKCAGGAIEDAAIDAAKVYRLTAGEFSAPLDPNKRLDSWKAIAGYLKRDESTVRRWEKEGLPVHRHLHAKKASVYAFPSEIDAWWNKDRLRLEGEKAPAGSRRRLAWVLAICSVLLVAGAGWLALGNRPIERPAENAITSIAVLPLENLSGDPQQDYFADGITEALISELGRITALRVMSRSSVMSYKGGKKPFEQVARELNVDALVEGAVVREGSRVRVTARLVAMRPERALWSERYDREISSILVLQADLARAIAGEVRAKLTGPERALLAQARAVDAEAYEAYIKGRFQFHKATPEDLRKATESFEEAIRKDPHFAPAYAGLADAYASAYRYPGPRLQTPDVVYPKARSAALKAIELDNTLAEAHASLGLIKEVYDWDWAGAERAYRRAIELNPSYATAHYRYAIYLSIPRRYEEAFAHMRRAEELDPGSRRNNGKGWLYFWSGQFDRAVQQAQTLLELEPGYALAHYHLGLAYLGKGKYEEAIASHRQAIAQSGETTRSLAFVAYALGKAGRTTEAVKIISDLTERARHQYVAGYQLAIAYMGVGNKEEALIWLERAFEQRAELGNLNRGGQFWLQPLQSEPRYQDLLRRLRLPG